MTFIEDSTEVTPFIIEKLNSIMIDAICDLFRFKKEELVIIGDRIYTDIKTASVSGIKSALVYSGETTKSMFENSDVKADYEYESIFEIAKEF